MQQILSKQLALSHTPCALQLLGLYRPYKQHSALSFGWCKRKRLSRKLSREAFHQLCLSHRPLHSLSLGRPYMM